MATFPKLYKKTSTGAIQTWTIAVEDAEIHTYFGQLDTLKPQHTVDVITKGKNIGKRNETTAHEQATAEAQSKWTRQKKKGYVESLDDARNGKVDKIIEGGTNPMLAHNYKKHSHKIEFPASVQPKLDGIRCIAMLQGGEISLWTRTRKRINSMPHIEREILERFGHRGDTIFDGELYNHKYRDDFEIIGSMVRQDNPHEDHKEVQYHVYDIVSKMPFVERFKFTDDEVLNGTYIHVVDTYNVETHEDITKIGELIVHEGYEGVMVRNNTPYEHERSYNLQKMKTFEDDEFTIVGFEEGRGGLMGHVGAFICEMEDGKTFKVKKSGSQKMLKMYFDDHSLWQKKQLTVKHQGLTGANGVPRFPVGMAIRDYE